MSDLTETDVRAAMERFDRSMVAGDYDTLALQTADAFLMVNPLAQTMDKPRWLAWIEADIRYSRIERDDPLIRLLPDAAIVTSPVRSWMAVVGLFDGVETIHGTYRTEVWTRAAPGAALTLLHVHLTRRELTDAESDRA